MRAANILTVSRVLLAPVVAYFILTDARYLAAVLYAIAALTDAIDGYLARKEGPTYSGLIFDGLADYFLIYLAIAALAIKKAFTPRVIGIIVALTVLLILLITRVSIKTRRFYLPHRKSIKCLAVLIHIAALMYILNFRYAEIAVYAVVVGGVYTAIDYIRLKKYSRSL